MKRTGLRNRFSEETRNHWLYWYSCLICDKNQQDVLHHIVSPSSSQYIDGSHNESTFNSCPIHNFGCHIGNEAYLYSIEGITKLLNKALQSLILHLDYQPDTNDLLFYKTYYKLYSSESHAIMSRYVR